MAKMVKKAPAEMKKKVTRKKKITRTGKKILEKPSNKAGVIQADFKALEATRDSNEWTKSNCARIKSWQKAAELKDPRAQLLLGLCCHFGHGIKQDYNEAAKWFRMAADQGLARAQYNLGFCYDNGDGVESDTEESLKWIRMAADEGHPGAMKYLDCNDENDSEDDLDDE